MKILPFYLRVGVQLIVWLAKTWRIEYQLPSKTGIVAFWHGDMLAIWYIFGKIASYSIVSPSKDGEILNLILQKWGLNVLRGSSSRGGKEALNAMVEVAKEGNFVLITPDGPQGPYHKIKAGAVIASIRAEVPLYFANIEINNLKVFTKSWDKFKLPYPFTKIKITIKEYNFDKSEYSREEIERIILNLENTHK
ncbi:MAG TPA: DUF374 domain-containing protein [Candidatus Kapabacteria bacterium]|nr:DUF374 domain-containing protein [Candidatus Kapabacteria bacterium]